MNELKVIEERVVLGKEFRIYGDFESPLFLAKDVAEWIEHSKSSMMLEGVSDDEKLKETIFTSGQNREMWFLTEDGLYEVLMQSRKPIAKEFKKQVKEILKSIRKHGAYMTDETLEKTISNPDFLIGLLQNLKQEQQARQIAESKLNEVKPKVEYHDVVLNNENFFPITNIAKDLGMTANKLNTYLSDLHVQYRRNGSWILYRDYDWLTTNGYADYKESQFGNQLKWSSKGKQFIIKLLSESKYGAFIPKEYLTLDLQNVVVGGIA